MYLEILLAVQRNTYSSLYMHAACPFGAVDMQVIAWMFSMRHTHISFNASFQNGTHRCTGHSCL